MMRRGAIAGLVTMVPPLGDATGEGRNRLVAVVRTFARLITVVSMRSATCAELHRDNLSQFTEPLRRAVPAQCGPLWGDVCQLLVQAGNT